jgi:hypothetical protein
MRYENDVSLMWRQLFHGADITSETVAKAEALLEELSPESPLRHRLAGELDEIRKLWKTQLKDNRPS